ncbi:MAG: N-acyl-D-amino-acid deacylase family protein [Ilumatobacteraceae bacterium]
MPFDLVFRDAIVVDGTGADRFVADVAVAGDRVAELGTVTGSGLIEVDASGLVLAPGFIDVHTHDDFALETSPDMAFKTLQGVTTVVTGNCGTSVQGFPGWIDDRRESPAAVNVAALVGHGTIREAVMGRSTNRPATAAELESMRDEVSRALDAGAVGMSTGLVYEPGRYSPAEEIEELARIVARRDGIYASHMRNEHDGLVESVLETMDVGRATGVKVQISHLKAIGAANASLAADAIREIRAARDSGLDVMADQYPYSRGSTALDQLVSADSFRRSGNFGLVSAAAVMIASAPRNPGWEGRTLESVAVDLGLDAADAARRIVETEGRGCMVVVANQTEENIALILQEDFVMIGSDGIPAGSRPHPRLHHTFPRVLGEYSRNRGVISLETAVHKMTGMSARRFGLDGRGVIAPNALADLVLFDHREVIDTGTYENPSVVPRGIMGVWANGVRVADESRSTHARPGRVLSHLKN